MGKLKVGLVQMAVTADKGANLRAAAEGVADCAARGAGIVALPEMFCCPYQASLFPAYAEGRGGRVWTELSAMARRHGVTLVGGSMPELGDGGGAADGGAKVYNTCFTFGRDGGEIGRHRKAHLFDVDIAGGQRFFESETLTAGDAVTVVGTEHGKAGVAICYDIRFPEVFRAMTERGAVMAFVPAAFNMTTGPAHWEVTFRARALDNQMFVFGCAPARDLGGPYVSYGNSIVASPWGAVAARLDEGPGTLVCEVDLGEVEAVRSQLPLLKAMRRDVYRSAEADGDQAN